jgi:hypothetical protein
MKKLNLNSFPQRSHLKCLDLIMALTITLAILIGCSHTEKVLIAPRVELKAYHNIGVIEFSTNAEDTLKPYITQNFIQNVQSAQPGTRILELGDQEQLLRSIGRSKLNPETIKSIGKMYNVEVFTAAKALNAKAYIEAALRTRILETDSGVTLWTRATTGKTQVARINLMEGGPISFGVSDPKEKYGKLVPELVYVNTTDFRSRYEYRTVE